VLWRGVASIVSLRACAGDVIVLFFVCLFLFLFLFLFFCFCFCFCVGFSFLYLGLRVVEESCISRFLGVYLSWCMLLVGRKLLHFLICGLFFDSGFLFFNPFFESFVLLKQIVVLILDYRLIGFD